MKTLCALIDKIRKNEGKMEALMKEIIWNELKSGSHKLNPTTLEMFKAEGRIIIKYIKQ